MGLMSQSILIKENKMPPFIIIVDKKPLLPDILEMIISKYYSDQFTILAFNNTTSAFNVIEELAIKKENIALILCSCQMPNLTGYEFLNLITTLSPTSTKVLSTTYMKLSEYQELLSSDLIDFILEKPYNTNSLINIIQSTVKQQNDLITNQKCVETIQSLKNSLATMRSKFQTKEQTLLTISNSLNSFYFRINLKNSLLDVYTTATTIFGYNISKFNDFDSFLSIVVENDQQKLIESVKKIKVMLTKQDKLYFNIIDHDNNRFLVKSLLIGEEIDSHTGTESIIGFVQNVSTEIAEFKQIITLNK